MTQSFPAKHSEIRIQTAKVLELSERLSSQARAAHQVSMENERRKSEIEAQTRSFLNSLPITSADRTRIADEIVGLIAPAAEAKAEAQARNLVQLRKDLAKLDALLYPLQSKSTLLQDAADLRHSGALENAENLKGLDTFLRLSRFFTESLGVTSREIWTELRDLLKEIACSMAQALRCLKLARAWIAQFGPARADLHRLLRDLRESVTQINALRKLGAFWSRQMAQSRGEAARAASAAHRKAIKDRLIEIATALRAMKAVRRASRNGTSALDAALRDLKAQYGVLAAQRHLGRSRILQAT